MQPAVPNGAFTELDLIARAQEGDRWAFGELVRSHWQGVVNVVYRMCGDAALAEDAAQDTFIQAWEHLPGYRPRSAFRNWLYRIATNRALDLLRKERPASDIEALALADPQTGPEGHILSQEQAGRVRAAVLMLPPASRSVLVLREYEGLPYRDIADALGIPLGTVMSRLSYARQFLREHLAADLEA